MSLAGDAQRRMSGVLPKDVPICVDLDGTLLRTDMFIESFVEALRRDWTTILRFLIWLARGKANLKRRLAVLVDCEPATLPYNTDLLSFLLTEREGGRKLALVTASDLRLAQPIASYLGIFDEVIASDGITNVKGSKKAELLVRRFGNGGFIYAGNDTSDLPVWRESCGAIVVNAPRRVRRAVDSQRQPRIVLPGSRRLLKDALRELRVYQWVKNLLVFVVPTAGHALADARVLTACVLLFFAFSLAASGIYVLNDLLDLSADRRHPRKRRRPLASGSLPLQFSLIGPVLLLLGFTVSYWVSVGATAVVILYVTVSFSYSLVLKTKPLVDVFVLAALYALRVFAGGVGSGIEVSVWLLTFSGFLFLALAFLKRCSELRALRNSGEENFSRRGYVTGDLPMMEMMGVGCSFVASVVLALYVDSEPASSHYAEPVLLWGTMPLFVFWQCRLWLATARGFMHDDPIVYTARDWVSWCVFAVASVLYVASSVGLPSLLLLR